METESWTCVSYWLNACAQPTPVAIMDLVLSRNTNSLEMRDPPFLTVLLAHSGESINSLRHW